LRIRALTLYKCLTMTLKSVKNVRENVALQHLKTMCPAITHVLL
jgi:hypothetical protein